MSSLGPSESSYRCPRCASALERHARTGWQRVVSRAYPVKYYKCSKRCGYEALRASRRELKQRGKRALIVLAALVVLAVLASGTAVLVEGVSAGGDAPVE